MSLADLLVLVLGTALIATELWYFLWPRAATTPPGSPDAPVQEIHVVVRDGYDPSTIFVEAGRKVRLLFYRDETAACSERLVFDTLPIDQELPAFRTTAVEFTPSEAGDYPFRCGKNVLRGRVVAQLGGTAARANLGKGHAKHG